MKKADKYILISIFLLLFISTIGIYGYQKFSPNGAGTTAVITQNGKAIYTIELDKVKESYDFTIENEQGQYNTIYVEPGSIKISDANCPDKLCVQTGTLSKINDISVCLPHGLFVEIKDGVESEIDLLAH